MLQGLRVRGFKSIDTAEVDFRPLTVLFGPNAAGKSNLLDAIQVLSRLGTERTVADALSEPIRGHPVEAFAFPPNGLSCLLEMPRASFGLEADLAIGREGYRYRIEVSIQPRSGSLSVTDEYLAALSRTGDPKGLPRIQKVDNELRIRRKSKPAHPRQEPVGLNHTILSDPRLGGVEYRQIERCREDLVGWRTYYLDPRVAMRSAEPPAEVTDIGVLGQNIAPFLYRLRAERPKHFEAIRRALSSLVPTIENVDVDLDKRRGTLDILIRQDGTDYSSRIISEGTLRLLALCAISANPWGGSLIAFEEPENGVHPRRIELIAQLLVSLAVEQKRQLVVTTHSPVFCGAVLRVGEPCLDQIELLSVRRRKGRTEVRPLPADTPLFRDGDIRRALTENSEDGAFENLVLRGLIDA